MKQSAKSLGLSEKDVVGAYADAYLAQRIQPGEFTIRMFVDTLRAKGQDVTWVQAQRMLDADPTLTFRQAIDNGRRCKAYRQK